MKTFCKFVGRMERSPKDVIMLVDKDMTLTEYFQAEGIITPFETETRPENPQNASLNRSTEGSSCRPSLPPTATISSRKALEAAGGITPFYCEICNIGNPPFVLLARRRSRQLQNRTSTLTHTLLAFPVFGSSQALGGHRSNSLEHKERVERLKKEGSIILLEHGQSESLDPLDYDCSCRN